MDELKEAWKHYQAVQQRATRDKDWVPFCDLFTENCFYVEHAYGPVYGRKALKAFYGPLMAPFPDMAFDTNWVTYDVPNAAIIFEVNNIFPPPFDPRSNQPFKFPNVTRLVYAGKLPSEDDPNRLVPRFKEEQDWYNPATHAKATTRAWRAAGGRFQAEEKVFMQHDKKKRAVKDQSDASKL